MVKKDKTMSILLKKKFASIDKSEISEALNEYKKQLNINEKIKISKVYLKFILSKKNKSVE